MQTRRRRRKARQTTMGESRAIFHRFPKAISPWDRIPRVSIPRRKPRSNRLSDRRRGVIARRCWLIASKSVSAGFTPLCRRLVPNNLCETFGIKETLGFTGARLRACRPDVPPIRMPSIDLSLKNNKTGDSVKITFVQLHFFLPG